MQLGVDQSVPLTDTPNLPRIPPELLWGVIGYAWRSEMPPRDRNSFFERNLRVNTRWTAAFLRLSGADVYISTQSFMEFYFSLLRGQPLVSKFLHSQSRHTLNHLCTSVTVDIINDRVQIELQTEEPEREKLLSDFLYRVKVLEALPNLKHLNARFQNVACDDLFRFNRLVDFPKQVESLSLGYTFKAHGFCLPQHMIETPPGAYHPFAIFEYLVGTRTSPNWPLSAQRYGHWRWILVYFGTLGYDNV
ncbi:hypothetical protein FA15DRAFT_654524 [Coprinopsis marcescibilis]|uniref:Uncharacterized protein n=1 Tax=Coprinopsis marcescibilis TaxID=230819 RepID=A0A5C3L077_COPMA|nr:hypothetical protein FA15DRAFT_654524 [Coprinopsis marcescibilis]